MKRKANEGVLQYYDRLKSAVSDGLIDLERSEIYELLYGDVATADYARRAMRILDLTLEADVSRMPSFEECDKSVTQSSNTGVFEKEKEKCKLSDYKTFLNQQTRDLSRLENLKEISIEMADRFNRSLPFINLSCERKYDFNKSGILVISDWHLGIEIDNYLNKYNLEVFKDRIRQLLRKTLEKIKLHGIGKIYVVNLNDLISGIIHNVIRLQNRENLVYQIMIVSETLAEMLIELSEHVEIEYHSTIDNHSRAIADKKQSLDKENFSLLIDWFLKERLKNTDIKICDNEFDDEICSFQIYGWNYLGVHGDKDKVTNVVQNLSLMTKRFYNTVLTAHYHHSSSDEIHSTYVFSNGCLSGVDAHSKDLRKTSNPSQLFVVVSEEDCCEDVCILKLN